MKLKMMKIKIEIMVEGKNRLILIIEDEEDILELLEYTLQKRDMKLLDF